MRHLRFFKKTKLLTLVLVVALSSCEDEPTVQDTNSKASSGKYPHMLTTNQMEIKMQDNVSDAPFTLGEVNPSASYGYNAFYNTTGDGEYGTINIAATFPPSLTPFEDSSANAFTTKSISFTPTSATFTNLQGTYTNTYEQGTNEMMSGMRQQFINYRQQRDSTTPIDLTTLTDAQYVQLMQDRGYTVVSLGSSRFEVGKTINFPAIGSIPSSSSQNVMIFNKQLLRAEKITDYYNGVKTMETIIEVKPNGDQYMHTKTFDPSNLPGNKNHIFSIKIPSSN